jgi:hypothetical protein
MMADGTLDGLDPTQKVDWSDPGKNVDHVSGEVLTGEGKK